jgi:type II secretory pathway pseudopilin PulG
MSPGRARGYTAVEVLLALTVMLISTAGVMSMQKASIQGNLDARKLDVANSIARTWLDRLETDTETWNAQTNNLTFTTWLSTHDTGIFGTPVVFSGPSAFQSPAFDILGRDVAEADPTVAFCTHIKVDTMASNVAGVPVMLRATVLVYWPKELTGTNLGRATPLCSEADVAHFETGNPGTYHMLFATEALGIHQ